LGKSIEIGQYKSMSPNSDGITPRTSLWLDPIEIAPMFKNVVEFYANENYHLKHPLDRENGPLFWGGSGQPAISPPFSNKKASLPEAHLI
jgi:hypothetical protein